MKILLDECVTTRLKKYLAQYDVYSVTDMKWNGLRNGNLISKSIEEKFDLLLTIDKNLSFQQNIKQYDIIVVILNSPSSNIQFLKNYIPEFEKRLNSFEKGKSYIIGV